MLFCLLPRLYSEPAPGHAPNYVPKEPKIDCFKRRGAYYNHNLSAAITPAWAKRLITWKIEFQAPRVALHTIFTEIYRNNIYINK